jgi:hypothetical protein
MAMKLGFLRNSPLSPYKNYSTIASYSSIFLSSVIALTIHDVITIIFQVGGAISDPALEVVQSKEIR